MLTHLRNGGVDFAHFDYNQFDMSENKEPMNLFREAQRKATGWGSLPCCVVDGKCMGGSDDVRAMCQTGYFQYKLKKAGVKHRLPGMKWIKDMYE